MTSLSGQGLDTRLKLRLTSFRPCPPTPVLCPVTLSGPGCMLAGNSPLCCTGQQDYPVIRGVQRNREADWRRCQKPGFLLPPAPQNHRSPETENRPEPVSRSGAPAASTGPLPSATCACTFGSVKSACFSEPTLAQGAMNPENTVFDAKRLIGRKLVDPDVQQDLKNFPFKG